MADVEKKLDEAAVAHFEAFRRLSPWRGFWIDFSGPFACLVLLEMLVRLFVSDFSIPAHLEFVLPLSMAIMGLCRLVDKAGRRGPPPA